jgi:hypothetical protein
MSKRSTGWSREFDEPIALADGGKLETLRVPRRWRQSAFPGRVVAPFAALAALAVFSSVRMRLAMGWSDALPAAYAASAK